jgi:hypothetical protein
MSNKAKMKYNRIASREYYIINWLLWSGSAGYFCGMANAGDIELQVVMRRPVCGTRQAVRAVASSVPVTKAASDDEMVTTCRLLKYR